MPRMHLPWIRWILPIAATASAVAQVDAFDEAVRVGLDDPAVAARATQAILRVEPGPPRDARLATAARAAFVAGEHELCVRWSTEAERCEPLPQAAEEARLRSLIVLGRSRELSACARAAAARMPAALDAALAAEEARCVVVADGLMRDGDLEAGLSLFARIAGLAPVAPSRLCNYALALRHAGQLARSREVYEQALAIAPADAWTWNDYGLLLRASGEPAAATRAFRRSLGCDARPGEGPGITNVVLEAALGSPSPEERSGALESASHALAIRPDAALLRRATVDLALGPKPRRRAELEPDTAAGRR